MSSNCETEVQLWLDNYNSPSYANSTAYVNPRNSTANAQLHQLSQWVNAASPQWYFEVVIRAAAAGNDTYVELHTSTGGNSDDATTDGGAVGSSAISTSSTAWTRVRSGLLTLTADNRYKVMIKNNSAASLTGVILSAKLICVDSMVFPTTSNAQSSVIMVADGQVISGTSYATPTDAIIIKYDAAPFVHTDLTTGVDAVYLEATLGTGASGTTYCQLYDVTGASAVASSEISNAVSSTTTHKRSGALTLIDGHEYVVQFKRATANGQAQGVRIIFRMAQSLSGKYVAAMRTYHMHTPKASTTSDILTSKFLYTAANYGGTVTWNNEATLKSSIFGEAAYTQVYNSIASWGFGYTINDYFTRVRISGTPVDGREYSGEVIASDIPTPATAYCNGGYCISDVVSGRSVLVTDDFRMYAPSYQGSNPHTISGAGGGMGLTWQRVACRTKDGTIHHIDSASGKYYYSRDNGATWSGGTACAGNSMCADPSTDNIYFAYDDASHNIYFIKGTVTKGSPWTWSLGAAVLVDSSTNTLYYPAIACDYNGYIHIVYERTDGAGKWARSITGGASWIVTALTASTNYYAHGLDIDSQNNIYVVSCYIGGASAIGIEKITYNGGGSWTQSGSYTVTPATNSWPGEVVVLPDDRVLIIYTNGATTNLYTTRNTNVGDLNNWDTAVQVSASGLSSYQAHQTQVLSANTWRVYYDSNSVNANYDIFYRETNNAGTSYASAVAVTNNNTYNKLPRVSQQDGYKYDVFWANGNGPTYTKHVAYPYEDVTIRYKKPLRVTDTLRLTDVFDAGKGKRKYQYISDSFAINDPLILKTKKPVLVKDYFFTSDVFAAGRPGKSVIITDGMGVSESFIGSPYRATTHYILNAGNSLAANNTSFVDFPSGSTPYINLVYLNLTGHFTNPSVRLYIYGRGLAANSSSFALFDVGTSDTCSDAGTQVGPTITITSTSDTWVESQDLVGIGFIDGHRYKLKFKNDVTASATTILYGAWLVVTSNAEKPSGMTAHETTVQMGEGAMNGSLAAYGRYGSYSNVYLHEESAFSGSVAIYFEANFANSNAANTSYISLWDITDGVQVADSEITVTGTTFKRVRSPALTLTDGHEYAMEVYSSGGTSYYISIVRLIFISTGTLTKIRTYLPLSARDITTSNTYARSFKYCRYWPFLYSWFLKYAYSEFAASNSAADTCYYHFVDDSGTSLAGSEVTNDSGGSSTPIRVRSADIKSNLYSGTGMRRYCDEIKNTGGVVTVRDGNAHIILDLQSVSLVSKSIVDALGLSDYFDTDRKLPITDSLSLTDVITRPLRKFPIVDSFTLADAINRGKILKLTDTLFASDYFDIDKKLPITDTVNLADGILKRYGDAHASDSLSLTETDLHIDRRKPIVDALTLTDVIQKTRGLSIADSLALADAILKRYGDAHPSDSLSLIDAITRPIRRLPISDSLALAESIVKGKSLSLSDNLALTDVILKRFGDAHPSDSLSLTETDLHADRRKPIVDSLTLVDAILKTRRFTVVDALSITDAVLKRYGDAHPSDTLTLSETDLHADRRKPISDTLTLTDLIAKTRGLYVTDSLALTDIILKRIGDAHYTDALALSESDLHVNRRKAITDSLLLADAIVKGKSFSLTDSLALNDIITRPARRLVVPDSMTLTDLVYASKRLAITDVLALADAVVKGKAFSLTDSLTLTDVITRPTRSFPITDAVSLVDSVLKVRGDAHYTDTLSLVDQVFRGKLNSIVDAINLADAVLRPVRKLPISDALTLTDAVSTSKRVIATDTLSILDAVLRGRAVGIVDAVALADAIVRGKVLPISDGLTLTDVVSAVKRLVLSDSLTLSDVVVKGKTTTVLDTLLITDSVLRNKVIGLVDTLLLVDVITRPGRRIPIPDSLNLADAVALASKRNIISDALLLTDSVVRGKSLSISDSLALADLARVSKILQAVDALTLTESISRGKVTTVTDSLVLSDAINLSRIKRLTDNLFLTDSVLRNKPNSITDALSLADAISLSLRVKPIADTLNLAELLRPGKNLRVSDSLLISDLAYTSKRLLITDLLNLSEFIFSGGIFVQIYDSLLITDSIRSSKGLRIADSLSLADAIYRGKTLSFSDTLTLSDVITKQRYVSPILDSLALTDVILRNKSLPLSDVLALTDVVRTMKQLRLSDTLNLSDFFLPSKSKLVSDSISLAETVVRNRALTLTDTLLLSDALRLNKTLLTIDSLVLADALVKRFGAASISDALLLSDALVKGKTAPITDNLSLADAILKRYGAARLSDSLVLTDAVYRGRPANISDTLTLTDNYLASRRAAITDALSLLDSITKQRYLQASDALTISDVVLTKKALKIADTITLSEDIIQGVISHIISVLDSLNLVDTLTALKLRTILDNFTLSDTIGLASVRKLVQDSLHLTDVPLTQYKRVILTDILNLLDIITTLTPFKEVLDSISLQDSINITLRRKQAVDTLVLTDLFIRNRLALIQDFIVLTDNVLLAAGKKVLDSLVLTDAVTVPARRKPITDNLLLSDVYLTNKRLQATDSLVLTDVSLVRKSTLIQDTLTLFDVAIRGKRLPITDSLNLSDTALIQKSLTLYDALNLAEQLVRNRTIPIQDLLVLTESIVRHKSIPLAEALSLAEQVLRHKKIPLDDALALSDALLLSLVHVILDSIQLSDSVKVGKKLILADAIALADLIIAGKIGAKTIYVTDSLTITDAVLLKKLIQIIEICTTGTSTKKRNTGEWPPRYVKDSEDFADEVK